MGNKTKIDWCDSVTAFGLDEDERSMFNIGRQGNANKLCKWGMTNERKFKRG